MQQAGREGTFPQALQAGSIRLPHGWLRRAISSARASPSPYFKLLDVQRKGPGPPPGRWADLGKLQRLPGGRCGSWSALGKGGLALGSREKREFPPPPCPQRGGRDFVIQLARCRSGDEPRPCPAAVVAELAILEMGRESRYPPNFGRKKICGLRAGTPSEQQRLCTCGKRGAANE